MPTWEEVILLHAEAVKACASAALSVPETKWTNATNDQWAPAHILEHLTLVYEILLKELQTGEGMRVRTKFFVRHLLRWFVAPGLLRGKPFPSGVRAPREVRPAQLRTADQPVAIQTFKEVASLFDQTVQQQHAQNPKMQLTHAYFGKGNLKDSILLCARHIQHHTRSLRAQGGTPEPL